MKQRLFLLATILMLTLTAMGQNRYLDNIAKAKQGDALAQCNVGYAYEKGEGVTQDYAQAVYWYKKAADQGHYTAQNNLGVCYEIGEGVTQDYAQAVYWYKKAAEQGLAQAQYNLGVCYDDGKGVAQDYAQAVYWYKKAADQGHENARKWLVIAEDKLRQQNKQNLATNNNNQQQRQQTVVQQPVKKEEKQEVSTPVVTLADVDKNIPSTGASDRNTYAVIIGNEKYKNEAEVPFAENDAQVFKEYAQKTLGVQPNHIKMVTNGTLNEVRAAIRWLKDAMQVCGGQGKAIFYYAGHGIPDEAQKTAYLLPTDGYGSDVESGYALSRLYDELSKMQAQRVTVFLDACFSGTKRDGSMMASARGVAIKVKAQAPQGKMVVFTAAQDDQTAYPAPSQRHGIFTYCLLRKLQDTRGDVTLGQLGDYLKQEVPRLSFDEKGKMQTPTVASSPALQGSWRQMKLK